MKESRDSFLSALVFAFIAWILQSDYDWRGVLMIVMFYMLRARTIEPWKDRVRIDYPRQSFLQIIFTFPLMMHYGTTGAFSPQLSSSYMTAHAESSKAQQPSIASTPSIPCIWRGLVI